MTTPHPNDLDHVQGVALASLLLTTTTVRLLHKNGALKRRDVDALFGSVLSNLEKMPYVTEPAAHAARSLLSDLATSMGLVQKKPH